MKKILQHLEKHGKKFELLEHKTVYTALDLANTLKIKLDEVAKNLLIKVDRHFVIAILSATHNIDLKKLQVFLKKKGYEAKVVAIPDEKALKKIFAAKKGGMPAFGSLYKIPVVLEKKLAGMKNAVWNVGSFVHSVRMPVKSFIEMEAPVIGSFGIKKKIIKPKVQKKKKKITVKKSKKALPRRKKNYV